jgi:hypothetical protein
MTTHDKIINQYSIYLQAAYDSGLDREEGKRAAMKLLTNEFGNVVGTERPGEVASPEARRIRSAIGAVVMSIYGPKANGAQAGSELEKAIATIRAAADAEIKRLTAAARPERNRYFVTQNHDEDNKKLAVKRGGKSHYICILPADRADYIARKLDEIVGPLLSEEV